jgi:hypothetical protein
MNVGQRCNIAIVEQIENSTLSTLKIPMASIEKDAIVAIEKFKLVERGDQHILEVVGGEEDGGIHACSSASWEEKT